MSRLRDEFVTVLLKIGYKGEGGSKKSFFDVICERLTRKKIERSLRTTPVTKSRSCRSWATFLRRVLSRFVLLGINMKSSHTSPSHSLSHLLYYVLLSDYIYIYYAITEDRCTRNMLLA